MDAVQEFYQQQVKPLAPDARLHLAQLILNDLSEFAGNWAAIHDESDSKLRAEQWLREVSELRQRIMDYRVSQGLPPVMSQEKAEKLMTDIEPDDDVLDL